MSLDVGALEFGGLDVGALEAAPSGPEFVLSAAIKARADVNSGWFALNPPVFYLSDPIQARADLISTWSAQHELVLGAPIQARADVLSQWFFGGFFALTSPVKVRADVLSSWLLQSSITLMRPVKASGDLTSAWAMFAQTPRNMTVLVDGIDRTEYVELGVRGKVQGSSQGGSRGECSFSINNHGRTYWKPGKFDEVLVFIQSPPYRIFGGQVDHVQEFAESGSSGLIQASVSCLDFGSLLDQVVIGKHYNQFVGSLANIIMADVVAKYLSSKGISWGGTAGQIGINLGIQTFNWITAQELCKQIAEPNNWDYYVDQHKVLRMFPHATGRANAPFSITTNNALWRKLTSDTGGAYANSVYARNSQDLGTLFRDTFTGNGSTTLFLVTAELKSRPVVYVNSVAQVVTEPGNYGSPWDWVWSPFSIYQNPVNSPLTPSDTLEIVYPSTLSYIAHSEDPGEIALRGRFDKIIEVQDQTERSAMQSIADAELAKSLADITEITVETDEAGLEPGQLLNVNTLRPPVNDDFLISDVSWFELGKARIFRFNVKASNAQLQRGGSGTKLFSQLLDNKQARDRVEFEIRFGVAETVRGLTNPGLQAGIQPAVRTAPKPGISRSVTVFFKSSSSVLTTVDSIFDIYQNGTSIFGPSTQEKLIWPAGATSVQAAFIFASDPLRIVEGDVFTLDALQADPAAMDGEIKIMCKG